MSSSAELNSGNLGSWCEAVIAVLQGLMSSRGGTSAEGVTGLELAEICQQSHMSVMGHNISSIWKSDYGSQSDVGSDQRLSRQ